MINKMIKRLGDYTLLKIILILTPPVIGSSVLTTYIISLLFAEEYTRFLFTASILVPMVLTPFVVYILLILSKHLRYFKETLEEEIQNSKKKDLILFEQARFVLMGEMMANISHQWKQPLNTMGLAVVSMRTSNQNEEERDNHFEIIENNINYLATTINDFMSFFDKKTYSEMRDLNLIVKEIKSIIHSHISSKNIEFNITIDNSYGNIKIASSMSQVILNFLSNAKDAFGDDNTIRKKIKLQFISNEYGLEVECCDNGEGIDESIKDRIFDPYFTTKEKKQGTGIGLYMSKEIIQKIFNGKIDLSSRQYSRSELYPTDNSGKTCFYIAIPYSSKCILQKEYE